jgi:hypothetical protein
MTSGLMKAHYERVQRAAVLIKRWLKRRKERGAVEHRIQARKAERQRRLGDMAAQSARLERMCQQDPGSQMWRYSASQRTRVSLWLDGDHENLRVLSASAPATLVALDSITELSWGTSRSPLLRSLAQRWRNGKGLHPSDRPWRCFAIRVNDDDSSHDRWLNFAAADDESLQTWFLGLQVPSLELRPYWLSRPYRGWAQPWVRDNPRIVSSRVLALWMLHAQLGAQQAEAALTPLPLTNASKGAPPPVHPATMLHCQRQAGLRRPGAGPTRDHKRAV